MTDGSRLLAGRYQIGDLIGRGGMADVHVGVDSRLNRKIAIKLLKPSLATDPKFRLLFREEAQKAARMAHPTIVRVFDAGEETVTGPDGVDRQVPFIVMEYVDGRLLRDIIAEGPLDPKEASRIVAQILTALEYSHRALLVHRDIKPGNVMITQSGQVKVMDFGIARAVSDNSATVAETGAVLGTAQYFSPEQARGETVDARTDLYSTGVIFFELLTGQAPFRGERAAAVAYQHISEAAAAPSSLNSAVSPAIDAVVLHSLSKDKFDRYQTAAEFRADVESAAAGEIPTRRMPAREVDNVVLGINPHAAQGSNAALRQLTPDDERVVRTQPRPPVAWIWAGFAVLVAMLVAVVFWVVNLPDEPPSISSGLSVTIPDVEGQTYEDAAATLEAADLVPSELSQASDTIDEGIVISTNPEPGARVASGQPVRVYVSIGPDPTTVPALDQRPEAEAIEAIEDRGLVYGSSTPERSTSIPEGVVIRADPESGANLREGDTVNLFVSNGLVEIPSVVGQPINTANTTLGELELNIVPVQDPNCAGGEVTAQSLPAGEHPQRSEISVTWCSG
ncbi:Stk1 family PASTA domain-containing Ser/Thr kinase [Marisediminicola sp. LYQ134]|uniref:Stk1 family PASTA domain-containing Ser/Thr kinase n=1 Tax=unclassified Marisediminicola TaxID=2618316 RepID=UPI00398361E8